MSMDFASWAQAATTILNVQDAYGVAAFNALAPRFIEYAELRIYRDNDLDFLATRTVDGTKVTSSGSRAVAIPSQFIVIEGVSLVTPANSAPIIGQRIPLLRTTRSFCDAIWPTEAQTKAPVFGETYWALYSQFEAVGSGAVSDEPAALPSAIIIAPTPDDSYKCEFTGTFRPAPLSETNQITYLTTYLPDLFLAATIAISATYQRDFGAGTAEDPSLAGKWEALYQLAKQGASVESARQKAQSVGWSPYSPAPLANVSRTANPAPAPKSG